MNTRSLCIERFLYDFSGAEDFVKYEIGLISEEEYYARTPDVYIPQVFLELFQNNVIEGLPNKAVILKNDTSGKTVIGTLKEWYDEVAPAAKFLSIPNTLKIISLKDYVRACETNPMALKIVAPYSPKTYFEIITQQALADGANEITIASEKTYAKVFVLINLQKKDYPIRVSKDIMEDFVKILTGSTKTYSVGDAFKNIPTGVQIDSMHRGRVHINTSYYGYLVTIRIFDQRQSARTLDDLNYIDDTANLFRKFLQNRRPGLKLFVGATLSGKSTAINAALHEYLEKTNLKCVSVEHPVEQINNRVIQIDAKTEKEYSDACKALIRHNPDIIYLAEINSWTSKDILEQANTGKTVFSTLHANSPADAFTRIQDLTGYSMRRIAMLVDTIIYQRLVVGTDGEIYPICSYINLDDSAKNRINQIEEADIYRYLATRQSKILVYTNSLIEKGCVSVETRNEVM